MTYIIMGTDPKTQSALEARTTSLPFAPFIGLEIEFKPDSLPIEHAGEVEQISVNLSSQVVKLKLRDVRET